MSNELRIEKSWSNQLQDFFGSKEFSQLIAFIENEYASKEVYPAKDDIFKAFNLTPFSKVKVVILGQDPYHGKGQATGLSFSVPKGVRLPPSLRNIYKEIESDLKIKKDFSDGDLESWAKQGVLLLNSVLTVVSGAPTSHKAKGWEELTDNVIRTLSEQREGIVFILWGNFAKSKKDLIDTKKHFIIESAHPSPLSARVGFFGSRPFSTSNMYLERNGNIAIRW